MREPADVLRLMALCGAHFAGPTWDAWRVVLRALFALPLSDKDLLTYVALTGRTEAPRAPASELWAICGRRAGKSIIAALIAVYLTTCRTYRLAPGERGVFMVIAADRRQARVVRRYIGGLLASSPVLAQLVLRETREAIELATGITIEIHTASFRTIRGYTVVGAVLDEVAFWPLADDGAAEPDVEILAALRPAMATVPGAVLLGLSSPYAHKGELHRAHRDHFGQDGDPVLVVQADTRTLNPTVPQAIIDRAMADDPARASAEYLAQFRSDIESFIGADAVMECVEAGVRERPPVAGTCYRAFCDPAGGSGSDAFALAIGHVEQDGGETYVVLDAMREWRPRFSPEAVVAEAAALLRDYRVQSVAGDRYAGEWPRESFRRHGVAYEVADRSKSELYKDALALLNSRRIELLDNQRLLSQIVGLERRTARGGRDSIDHAPGGHDDLANVVLGLAAAIGTAPLQMSGAIW